MPETPVDEDRLTDTREHHVGLAGQIGGMLAKSIAEPMGESSDDEFWASVLAAYARHARASLGRRKGIHVYPVSGRRFLGLPSARSLIRKRVCSPTNEPRQVSVLLLGKPFKPSMILVDNATIILGGAGLP